MHRKTSILGIFHCQKTCKKLNSNEIIEEISIIYPFYFIYFQQIMAESDDEYDRKRRDKFRGERSSGDNYRSDRRDDRRGRDDWSDR